MPDVFVAPDEKKDEVMHKRVPLSAAPVKVLVEEAKPSPVVPEPSLGSITSPVFENTPPVQPATPVAPQSQDKPKVSFDPVVPPKKVHARIPLFTDFWQNPQGVYFDTQEANEHILLFLRADFATNINWIFFTLLFLFLPFGVSALFTLAHYSTSALPPSFIGVCLAFYYLLVLTNAFTHFLGWYYNISLITPKRVLDIELKDLVDKKIAATKISLVQDVENEQSGTLRTLFNYGDVLIQTAGAKDNFYINACPKPEVVVRTVEQLIGKDPREGVNAA